MINFLAWDKAYAIFPRSTFIHRDGVGLSRSSYNPGIHAAKYERRGYAVLKNYSRELVASMPDIAQVRRPGDCLTWAIPFDTFGIQPAGIPSSVALEKLSLDMWTNRRGGILVRYVSTRDA